MDRGWLHVAARWARRGAALGLLLGASRFTWTTGSWALQRVGSAVPAEDASALDRRGRPSPETPGGAPPDAGAPEESATARKQAAKPDEKKKAKSARASRRAPAKREIHTLFVDLGPPRSEVFVDGVRVGHTPYAGSWSCKAGDEVRIHVLPRRGVPIESRAACRDSMRAVAGRNLDPDEVAALLADPTLPGSVKDALRR